MSLTKIHRDQMFLDSVASSFYREVYIHNVPQQFTTGITIYAGYLTKPLEGKHPASYRVPSTIPNSQELRPDDPEAATACVFVGMTPSPTILAEIKILRKQQASVDKRTTRGRSVKSLESKNVVDAIMHDTNALRVVAKKDGKTACFYSLINPNEKGLCTGVLVPGEDVFFFKACRDDDAKTVQARKDTSGAKIRDLMYGNGEHGPIYAGIKRKWIKKEEHERDVKLARILPAPLNLSGDGDDIVVKKAQLMNIMGVLMTARKEANWNSLDVAISLMRTIEQPSLPDEPASGLFEAKFVPPTKITNELCARVHSDIKVCSVSFVLSLSLSSSLSPSLSPSQAARKGAPPRATRAPLLLCLKHRYLA
jgi:hypothetical protein